MPTARRRSLTVGILVLIAVVLLPAIYHAPIWWVSLTAPNYPPEAFPDGVRIEFHMNGVFNGCKKVEKKEIAEEEALDCVHEMDTINHYVGMYPIASGGVLEKAFAPFLVSMLGVMLLGFAMVDAHWRTAVLTVGFAAVASWMYLAWYASDGLELHDPRYLEGLVVSLDQGVPAGDDLSPGAALIARLRESLEASGVAVEGGEESQPLSPKARSIEALRESFEKDQERRPVDGRETWDGSVAQMVSWHYGKNLARYFNEPERIAPMVERMALAGHVLFWVLIGAMVLLVAGTSRAGSVLYWLLIVPGIALPAIFVADYAAWLWWYGHNMNEMGAFSVKAFMPTVFGQGKVAQFSTHSYPDVGFGLMLVFAVVLIVAANQRFRQLTRDG